GHRERKDRHLQFRRYNVSAGYLEIAAFSHAGGRLAAVECQKLRAVVEAGFLVECAGAERALRSDPRMLVVWSGAPAGADERNPGDIGSDCRSARAFGRRDCFVGKPAPSFSSCVASRLVCLRIMT